MKVYYDKGGISNQDGIRKVRETGYLLGKIK